MEYMTLMNNPFRVPADSVPLRVWHPYPWELEENITVGKHTLGLLSSHFGTGLIYVLIESLSVRDLRPCQR